MLCVGKYESTFNDYLSNAAKYDLHPELRSPPPLSLGKIEDFKNTIVYGPPGSGKYTQALRMILPYSPSGLAVMHKLIVPRDEAGAAPHVSPTLVTGPSSRTRSSAKTVTSTKTEKKTGIAETSGAAIPAPPPLGESGPTVGGRKTKRVTNAARPQTQPRTRTRVTTGSAVSASGNWMAGTTPEESDAAEPYYRTSDVHYEIDIQQLGSGSKQTWHAALFHIVDVITTRRGTDASLSGGIILCKNIHLADTDLLDVFYSYMNHPYHHLFGVHVRFVLLSDHVCFFPATILARSVLVSVRRPSMAAYIAAVSANLASVPGVPEMLPTPFGVEALGSVDATSIVNIKELYDIARGTNPVNNATDTSTLLSDPLFAALTAPAYSTSHPNKPRSLRLGQFRTHLYNILVHKMDVHSIILRVLERLVEANRIRLSLVLPYLSEYFYDYNQGYRAIFHIERIFFRIWAATIDPPWPAPLG